MIESIAVCGAGTMGIGIAQVAAQAGFFTILFDLDQTILEKAKAGIKKSLQTQVQRNKITAEQETEIFARITFIKETSACIADLVIEAIVENAGIKISLFNKLAELNSSSTIFASNTSSLSISEIQKEVKHPMRVAGMHFFNPAPVMKLVEIVKGEQTDEAVAIILFDLCKKMNKTPVICKDAPGFIVNRVARHYYLEAMKLVEKGIASYEDVDKVMESSGFKMGPFKLMDLIGMDINFAVTKSIYAAFENTERFRPSEIQKKKVEAGELGIKSGKGFYNY